MEIPGKLLYKFPGPQDKASTIQEDCRGCTLWRSTQIYTKAFFHFLNFIRLHGTSANVISLTPTKIRLACYDFHRNITLRSIMHRSLVLKKIHSLTLRTDVWISLCQFSRNSKSPNKSLWTSPVHNFMRIGWKMQKIRINVYLRPYVQFGFRFNDFHKLAIFNSIMWRCCTPNFTHQLRNMGGTGINLSTPVNNVWQKLSQFSRNSCYLDASCDELLHRIAWKSNTRFRRWDTTSLTDGLLATSFLTSWIMPTKESAIF